MGMNRLAVALVLALGATSVAAERGKVLSFEEGYLYAPEKPVKGAPVLVVVDDPTEANQIGPKRTLQMMAWALKLYGVAAVAPQLPGERQPEAENGWKPTAALLARLEKDFKVKPGKLHAFGFYANGRLAYRLAFNEATRFAGIINADAVVPELTGELTPDQKKLRVLLLTEREEWRTNSVRERAARMARDRLTRAGLTVEWETLSGGMDWLLNYHAHTLLTWMTGRTLAEVTGDPLTDLLARAHLLKVKWRKRLPAALLTPPVRVGAHLVGVLAADGAMYVVAAHDVWTIPHKETIPHQESRRTMRLIHREGQVVKRILVSDEPLAQKRYPAGVSLWGESPGDYVVWAVHSPKGRGAHPDLVVGVNWKDGKVVWRRAYGGGVLTNIIGKLTYRESDGGVLTVTGRYVGFGTCHGKFRVLDARTGAQKWAAPANASCTVAALYPQDTVYVGTAAGVCAYDVKTGRRRWNAKVACPGGGSALAPSRWGILCVALNKKLIGLSTEDGARKWETTLEQARSAAPYMGDRVLICPTGRDLVGIDLSGKQCWKVSFDRPIVMPLTQGAVVLGDGRLIYLHEGNGEVHSASKARLKVGWPPALLVGVTPKGDLIGLGVQRRRRYYLGGDAGEPDN